jgi:hypothetical protein
MATSATSGKSRYANHSELSDQAGMFQETRGRTPQLDIKTSCKRNVCAVLIPKGSG